MTRLRRGHWAIQGEIDLHGLRRDEAREQLAAFMREAARRGRRCLRVVHGKGLARPAASRCSRRKVQRWLAQRADVIAFAQASAPQGGAGRAGRAAAPQRLRIQSAGGRRPAPALRQCRSCMAVGGQRPAHAPAAAGDAGQRSLEQQLAALHRFANRRFGGTSPSSSSRTGLSGQG